jgi:FkbM family methyltransferase
MNLLTRNLPMTRIRIFGASLLYRLCRLFVLSTNRRITRDGIQFDVDLSEGIDFSLFLFGSYQKNVLNHATLGINNDSVIFDIGANIGDMTLRFAKLAPEGLVYAFEPTHYALAKLQRNISLNPSLGKHIIIHNCFLSSSTKDLSEIKAYSSWKLEKDHTDKHKFHKGTIKSAEGVPQFSLDDFVNIHNIEKIGVIKIDTDGHEFEILKGGINSITRFQPVIVFEIGLYAVNEKGLQFSDFYDYFNKINYQMFFGDDFIKITPDNYVRFIPRKSTVDLYALPKEN